MPERQALPFLVGWLEECSWLSSLQATPFLHHSIRIPPSYCFLTDLLLVVQTLLCALLPGLLSDQAYFNCLFSCFLKSVGMHQAIFQLICRHNIFKSRILCTKIHNRPGRKCTFWHAQGNSMLHWCAFHCNFTMLLWLYASLMWFPLQFYNGKHLNVISCFVDGVLNSKCLKIGFQLIAGAYLPLGLYKLTIPSHIGPAHVALGGETVCCRSLQSIPEGMALETSVGLVHWKCLLGSLLFFCFFCNPGNNDASQKALLLYYDT